MPALRDTLTLSGGRRVNVVMPDLYALLATVGHVPSPAVAAVIRLLDLSGSLDAPNELQQLTYKIQQVRGMYELAALCIETPRLVLKDAERGAGELGPTDLTYDDLWKIYGFFRQGPHHATDTKDDGGTAGDAHDGDDVPLPTE